MNQDDLTGREWERARPPILVPHPAADVDQLRGRRVIVHDPEHGIWRHDLRAVCAPHGASATVSVVNEGDWYRELRGEEIALPWLVDLDRVWVEEPVDRLDAESVPDQSDIPVAAGRSRRLIEDTSRPPVRYPRPAVRAAAMVGARACVMTPEGPVWDQRIVGDPRRHEFPPTVLNFSRGVESLGEPVVGAVVPVVPEDDYYLWEQTGQSPEPVLHAARFVWIE
ncbi:hypothetical protein ABT324_30795 [Saccharopolyspora sp. NPDC000359]|uniref:hypothetical protein n=1 Tax=Saccharopolyspora sp. NPDC000359 TaxID=3154251 RepID=UPI00331B63CF